MLPIGRIVFFVSLWLVVLSSKYVANSSMVTDDDIGDTNFDEPNRYKGSLGANANMCMKPRLRFGRARIRANGRVAKFSCAVSHVLVGRRFATCVRGHWTNDPPICVAKGCKKLRAPYNGIANETYKGAVVMFECDPGYILLGSQTLYCDGNLWNSSVPLCKPPFNEPPTSCDFERDDMCGWSHDPMAEFDWIRHQFGTPSGHVGTGPSHDHTKGESTDGYYMYIEASSPRKENDTARLISPVYKPDLTVNGCFTFWYHMYGATTGFLKIYVKPERESFRGLPAFFYESGNQGNRWILGGFRLPQLTQNFQIIIEGIRGNSYIGDTAIDDVSIVNSVDCLNTLTTRPTTLPGPTRNITGSCKQRCNVENPEAEECQCVDKCEEQNTCCSDYKTYCATTDIKAESTPTLSSMTQTELTPSAISSTFLTDSSTVKSLVNITTSTDFRFPSSSDTYSVSGPLTSPLPPAATPLSSTLTTTQRTQPSPNTRTTARTVLPTSTTLSSSTILTKNTSPSFNTETSAPTTMSSPVTPSTSPSYSQPPRTTASTRPSTTALTTSGLTRQTRYPTRTRQTRYPLKPTQTALSTTVSKSPATLSVTQTQTTPQITGPQFFSPSVPETPTTTVASGTFKMSRSFPSSLLPTTEIPTTRSPTTPSTLNPTTKVYSKTFISSLSTVAVASSSSTTSPVHSATISSSSFKQESSGSRESTPWKPKWTLRPYRSSTTTVTVDDPRKAEKLSHRPSTSVTIGVAMAGVVIACIIAVAIYISVKRRMSKQQMLAEDSDVRYLKDGEIRVEFSDGSPMYDDDV